MISLRLSSFPVRNKATDPGLCLCRPHLLVFVLFSFLGDLFGNELFSLGHFLSHVELDVVAELLKLENSLIKLRLLLAEELLELVTELGLNLSLHEVHVVFEETELAVHVV